MLEEESINRSTSLIHVSAVIGVICFLANYNGFIRSACSGTLLAIVGKDGAVTKTNENVSNPSGPTVLLIFFKTYLRSTSGSMDAYMDLVLLEMLLNGACCLSPGPMEFCASTPDNCRIIP